MTLSDLAALGSFVSGIAVLASLAYLAQQMRQGTTQMQMAEMNEAQVRFTQLRLAIASSRDVAQLWTTGLEDGPLDAVDEVRFRSLLSDHCWSIFHTWDRNRRRNMSGDVPSPVPVLARLLTSKRGMALWQQFRLGFPSSFGEEVDAAVLAENGRASVAQ